MAILFAATLLSAGCGGSPDPRTAEVRVAVATNFAEVQTELAHRFEERTGVRIRASTGASGQLYAQIVNGAPFDVFLSADAERPARLEREGWAVPGTRFTYAEGRLALYGPGLDSVRAGGADLREGGFTRLAIANPRTAPYGVAAEQVLSRLGVDAEARSRVVQGENIGQTYQFVRSGAAELGFVALSQVLDEPRHRYWVVPADHHDPIAQDAVLLREGAGNPAAREYLAFLRSGEAREVIEAAGYSS